MDKDIIFKTNSLFDSVNFDDETGNWFFYFENKIYASSYSFWRVLKTNRIKWISLDNGHQFGLPHPKDLVKEISEALKGKYLYEIKVDKDTADLTLTISDEIVIQIFIISSGYESYEFSIDNERYIGLGSGYLGIVEATDNPQVFTTRHM